MLNIILDFLISIILFFGYLDGLMFKFRAEDMSITAITVRFIPMSAIGILVYFGLLAGILGFITKFITKPVLRWLKRRKLRQVRNLLARHKIRQRASYRKHAKFANFFMLWVKRVSAYAPKAGFWSMLVAVFLINLIPLPYLTLISVIVVKLAGKAKVGLIVVLLANFFKPLFLLFIVPWLYHFIIF